MFGSVYRNLRNMNERLVRREGSDVEETRSNFLDPTPWQGQEVSNFEANVMHRVNNIEEYVERDMRDKVVNAELIGQLLRRNEDLSARVAYLESELGVDFWEDDE